MYKGFNTVMLGDFLFLFTACSKNLIHPKPRTPILFCFRLLSHEELYFSEVLDIL